MYVKIFEKYSVFLCSVKQQYASLSQSAFRFQLASGNEHPQVGLVRGHYWKLGDEKLQKICE